MYQVVVALLLSVTVMSSQAAVTSVEFNKDRIATMTKEEKMERVNAIKLRVNEIKAMDKSTLTKAEKKELKKELKDMRKEARALETRGIYLSIGAVIIIILLLILIL